MNDTQDQIIHNAIKVNLKAMHDMLIDAVLLAEEGNAHMKKGDCKAAISSIHDLNRLLNESLSLYRASFILYVQ